jgi:hypothetical protein
MRLLSAELSKVFMPGAIHVTVSSDSSMSMFGGSFDSSGKYDTTALIRNKTAIHIDAKCSMKRPSILSSSFSMNLTLRLNVRKPDKV